MLAEHTVSYAVRGKWLGADRTRRCKETLLQTKLAGTRRKEATQVMSV